MYPPPVARGGGRPARRRYAALLAVPLVGLPMATSAALPDRAGAASTATTQMVAPLEMDADSVPVTLITGDTVTYVEGGDGPATIEVDPAPREEDRAVRFLAHGTAEDFYVYPTDAMEYIAAGVVDRELFNVPELVRQGLDDLSSDTLPVIVRKAPEAGLSHRRPAQSRGQLAQAAGGLPATEHPIGVESIQGAGVQVDRGRTHEFWAAVAGDRPDRGAVTALRRGVSRIQLDPVLEVALADSVPQIGAPQAWDDGYTGEGVTVAVLDTGVDASHPDLAGKVVAEANFTDEEDASDRHGHGTHVASTVAGTGAASDGQYTGVAPDAELMSGKVCNVAGECPASWVMAGMEWAAENGADIVNMSLGGVPTAGDDPLSQLVNQLTAAHGSLFVIAAGNAGAAGVGAPAVADAALAVGAVDKSDELAPFSARGPRIDDFAVKPNLTAPGVEIVAARGEGTRVGPPVDDHYARASGTSMAAPHVAGAAAVLTQALPELTAPELRDALVSTAHDGGDRWFEQGSGRVDVARAVTQGVYASASVDFGRLGAPGTPVERHVTYRNHTDTPVSLALEVSATTRAGDPLDNVSLSSDTVTVPAGGQTVVTAAADPTGTELGASGGVITATGPGVELRTPVGFAELPDEHEVTVTVRDGDGDPYPAEVFLVHDSLEPPVDSFRFTEALYSATAFGGTATLWVPEGSYTLMGLGAQTNPDTGELARVDLLTEVDIEVGAATEVTVDARESVHAAMPDVPQDVHMRGRELVLYRPLPTEPSLTFDIVWADGQWIDDSPVRGTPRSPIPVHVSPAPPGDELGPFLDDYWLLAEPKPLRSSRFISTWPFSDIPAYSYHLGFAYGSGIPDDLDQRRVTRRDLVEVPTRYHADDPDEVVRYLEHAVPAWHRLGFIFTFPTMVHPVGETTQYYLADDNVGWLRTPQRSWGPDERFPDWMPTFHRTSFPESEAGSRRPVDRWFEPPLRPGAVDVDEEYRDFLTRVVHDPPTLFAIPLAGVMIRGGADGNEFTPGNRFLDGNLSRRIISPFGTLGRWESGPWRMWNLDTGAELEPEFKSILYPAFDLSPQPARYRLEHRLVIDPSPDEDGPERAGREVDTAWTFQSRPSGAEVPFGYHCRVLEDLPLTPPFSSVCQFQPLIQLRYELGLDLQNRAPAGRAHVVSIGAGAHSQAPQRAPVTSMSVEYSTDDGATWQEARVVGQPVDDGTVQTFRVIVKHPRLEHTDGYVSLRVTAEDADGNTVEQTAHRVYQLIRPGAHG